MVDFHGSLPFVSVFVAARNEEGNLEACIRCLFAQNYGGRFEILLADDDSEDHTWQIANRLTDLNDKLRIFRVNPVVFSQLPGKQKALAQLAQQAGGDVFLFCDADMRMPATWISGMVAGFNLHRTEIINGSTIPAFHSFFQAIQALDWMLPQMVMWVLGYFRMAYTGMGNNMGITRNAYFSLGGFENMPASLTEDYELFRQAQKAGFVLIHLFQTDVLGLTLPEKTLKNWFTQHLRWMHGFQQLSLLKKTPVYLNLFLLPAIVLLLFFNTQAYVLSIIAGIFFLKFLTITLSLVRIRQFRLIPLIPIFEIIYPLFYLPLLGMSFFRREIVWKGRQFNTILAK